MAPRGLPVFDEPLYPQWTLPARGGCKVDASALSFVQGRQGVRHITVYGTRQAAWKLAGHSGFRAVPEHGELNADNGFEQRVAIHYDGKDPVEGGAVQCLDRLMGLFFRFSAPAGALPQEVDRIISIDAASVSGEGWETVPGLGSRGSALRSRLDLASAGASVDSGALAGITPLRYRFTTGTKTDATLKLVALPVHPLTSLNRLRLAVRLDGGALQVLDFEIYPRPHRCAARWCCRSVRGAADCRRVVMARVRGGGPLQLVFDSQFNRHYYLYCRLILLYAILYN